MKLLSILMPTVTNFILSGGLKKTVDVGVKHLQSQIRSGDEARKTLESLGMLGVQSDSLSDLDFIKSEVEKKFNTVLNMLRSCLEHKKSIDEAERKCIEQFAQYNHVMVEYLKTEDIQSMDKIAKLIINHPLNNQLQFTVNVQYQLVEKKGNLIPQLKLVRA